VFLISPKLLPTNRNSDWRSAKGRVQTWYYYSRIGGVGDPPERLSAKSEGVAGNGSSRWKYSGQQATALKILLYRDARMCFSATASFTATTVLGTIGIATLRHVREPRALLFASVPLLFAFHQFCEGLVWLGLEGRIGKLALDHVAFLFTLYAQGILPLLMPIAVLLLEPPGWRRHAILGLTCLGAVACVWDSVGLIFYPSTAFIQSASIAYRNPLTASLAISTLYILATCGALLLSSHRVVRAYGALNVFGLTIVEIVKGYAFASVWCFYAASLSAMIYWQFNRRNIDIATPNRRSVIRKPFLLSWLRWRPPAVNE
jgi:hypothetical protein